MELLQHIKYTLVFDENTDKKELDKLFGCNTDQDKLLLQEIVEEEKLGEVLAKTEDTALIQ